MTVGDRIRELRKIHGLTQEQLALQIGLERSSIGKYEGKSGITPSDEIKIRIADFFHVSLDYLCGRADRDSSSFFMTPDELKLLSCYRSLNIDGKQFLQQSLMLAMNTYSSEKNPGVSGMENQAR